MPARFNIIGETVAGGGEYEADMATTTKWRIGLQMLLATSLCGSTFQVSGCLDALGKNFNPCGTILNCNPAEFDLIHMDALQPNYEFNPTCALPGLLNCTTPISLPTGPTTGTTGITGTTTTTTTTGGSRTGTRGGTSPGFGIGT